MLNSQSTAKHTFWVPLLPLPGICLRTPCRFGYKKSVAKWRRENIKVGIIWRVPHATHLSCEKCTSKALQTMVCAMERVELFSTFYDKKRGCKLLNARNKTRGNVPVRHGFYKCRIGWNRSDFFRYLFHLDAALRLRLKPVIYTSKFLKKMVNLWFKYFLDFVIILQHISFANSQHKHVVLLDNLR